MAARSPVDQGDDFRSLCMAVGFVVLNWGMIDQQIDILVNIVFRHCGGNRLRKDGDVPRAMKQKLTFLKQVFRSLPTLRPFAIEGRTLIKRIEERSRDRNDLVHGSIKQMEPVDGIYEFHIVEYHRDGHSVRSFKFGPNHFSTYGEVHGDLLTELIQFSEKLGKQFPESPG